jgi:hypothetical protein
MLTIRDIKEAEKNGISERSLRYRIRKGMSKEEAINTPNYAKETREWREKAEQNGIPRSTFYNRIYRDGWDYERASTQPVHTETEYQKWIKVAKSNGIRANTFRSRVNKMGMDYETAATTPLQAELNKEYRKWLEVAKQNGIKQTTYRNRIGEYGWSCEKAATTPVFTQYRRKSG